ncbi:MAG TPA: hypothetical protein PL009_13425 [Flavipsychrobacter sp.]|nr:hypothetical protein [Flavipsychrobacter sp.]
MKTILLGVLLIIIAVSVRAQNSSATASQAIQLILHPTIDIKFTNATAGTIDMVFNSADNYSQGVLSGMQELEVRSNKNFKISVKTDAPTFAYSGEQNAATMPVSNTLFMAVTNNQTGGTLGGGFNNYTSLSANNQDLILNGTYGQEKKLVLAYKAKPEIGFPAGTYSVGVIYTATQP